MRARLAGPPGGWLVAAALGGYVLVATREWNVPEPGAVPFGPLWLAATTALGALVVAATRARLGPVLAIAIGTTAAMLLTDVSYLATQGLRDLHLYVRAGERFLAGEPVYLTSLFTARPADLADYPFVYPPLTLPVFGALARLPAAIVDVAWLAGSVAAAVATLRLFGIRGRWAGLLLLWPPFFQGLQVGNVAVPLGLLFGLAPWLGAGLVVAAVFKVYSGLAALWLVRERHPLQLVAGLGIVALVAVVTLPLTGTERWVEWWRGLQLFRESQPLLPDYLYGFGLPRYLPEVAVLTVAAAVTVAALRVGGREGLARLGLATVVASPSLYAHGLIVGLPALLALRPFWLWTALAITSVAPGIAWWAAIALAIGSWWLPALRRPVGVEAARGTDPDDSLHPLPAGVPPWPAVQAPDSPLAAASGQGTL